MSTALAAPHSHAAGGGGVLDVIVIGLAALAAIAYVAGVAATRRRGRPWPWHRTAWWMLGVAAATSAMAGPLAAAAHDDFVAHMTTHLLAGMLAPLLLVLAAPVTLALRTLAVTPARRLSAVLRSIPARVIAHPVSAALLSVGGLWLIYTTPVFEAMQAVPLVHLVVHVHLVAAGYLFTAAVVGLDPRPHPPRRMLVAAVLVAAIAAHGILAKVLYAHPPGAVPPLEAQQGAQLMYYAGAWIEAVVVTVFCAQWYRAAGRRLPARSAAPRAVRG